jgi:hypothetical protein
MLSSELSARLDSALHDARMEGGVLYTPAYLARVKVRPTVCVHENVLNRVGVCACECAAWVGKHLGEHKEVDGGSWAAACQEHDLRCFGGEGLPGAQPVHPGCRGRPLPSAYRPQHLAATQAQLRGALRGASAPLPLSSLSKPLGLEGLGALSALLPSLAEALLQEGEEEGSASLWPAAVGKRGCQAEARIGRAGHIRAPLPTPPPTPPHPRAALHPQAACAGG